MGLLRPQMPPAPGAQNSLVGAFSGNPQFQQQLQAMMTQQGPGFLGPQMVAPPAPMGMQSQAPGMGGRANGALLGNPMNNYGMQMGDPMQFMLSRLGPQQF